MENTQVFDMERSDMKEGLYIHVDDVGKVLDTFGSKSGTGMTIINEAFIKEQLKERSELYVTPGGSLIRRVYDGERGVGEESP